MVTAFEFDKYLEHSKEESYRIHQDEKNFSSLRTFYTDLYNSYWFYNHNYFF